MSNTGNVVGGYKANLNNPNTSEEAKLNSREVLDQHFDGGEIPKPDENKNPGNVYVQEPKFSNVDSKLTC